MPVTTQELTNTKKVNIFPNPTSDSLNIEINSSDEIKQIQLLNLERKLIHDCISSTTKLDVSSLEVGIYFLRIELDNGQQTIHKLIVN